jgi:hypothetical protein
MEIMSRAARQFSVVLIALLALVLLLPVRGHSQTPPKEKIPLRILYAGHPGSNREADFVGFLKQYFREVKTGDLARFDAKQAAEADVILLDYDGDGFKAPRPNLPAGYARPTVTLGVAGAFICSQRGLKTGYL